jgi:hypothetical protein
MHIEARSEAARSPSPALLAPKSREDSLWCARDLLGSRSAASKPLASLRGAGEEPADPLQSSEKLITEPTGGCAVTSAEMRRRRSTPRHTPRGVARRRRHRRISFGTHLQTLRHLDDPKTAPTPRGAATIRRPSRHLASLRPSPQDPTAATHRAAPARRTLQRGGACVETLWTDQRALSLPCDPEGPKGTLVARVTALRSSSSACRRRRPAPPKRLVSPLTADSELPGARSLELASPHGSEEPHDTACRRNTRPCDQPNHLDGATRPRRDERRA